MDKIITLQQLREQRQQQQEQQEPLKELSEEEVQEFFKHIPFLGDFFSGKSK